MGFSVSAATAIIGVALLLSFEFMVANVIPTLTDTHDSYDEMKDRAVDQIQTNINITDVVNISGGPNYDLSITVKNTGSVTLKTSDFNVLQNGTSQSFTCSKTNLFPEDSAYFNLTSQPGSGKLKIITNNGIYDYYTYTI